MRTIVISGASGFIGSALSQALRERGDRVRALVRPGHAGDDGIFWDPAGGTIDQRALEGVDAVVHLAGESVAGGRWNEQRKREIRESRARGTNLVASAVARLRRPPSVLISASAVGLYGDRADEQLDETSSRGADFLAEVVQTWEAAAQAARDAGVRVAHPRFGLVLAPHGGALAKMLLPFKLGLGAKLGTGKQWMSWVALEDAIAAILYALDRDEFAGAFNVTAPEPVTNEEFTRVLAQALRRPAPFKVPAFAARLAFGEMAETALLSGARVLPKRLLESGFTFAHPRLEPFLARCFA